MTNTEAVAETFPALFEGDFAQIDSTKFRGRVFIVKAAPGLGSRRTRFLLSPVRGGQDVSVPTSIVMDRNSRGWQGTKDEDLLRAMVAEAPALVLREGAIIRLSSAKYPGLWVLTGSTQGKFRAISLDGSSGVRGITPVSVAEIIDPARITVSD